MPKSKVRKKTVYTPPPGSDLRTPVKVKGPTHPVYIAVMLGLMLVNLLLTAFTDTSLGIRESGPLGIAFSVVAILLGCFFLLMDFDTIEQGVYAGMPEKFAWYCAFGLVLSLVWIYLELLRLLAIVSSFARD